MDKTEDIRNYWDNPELYQKRNKDMYEKRKKGVSTHAIALEYGMTDSNAHRLIKREKDRNNFKGTE
jgi:hypothetical protein